MADRSAIWISWTDEAGNEGSARYGGRITNEDIDQILFAAQRVLGQPDTVE